MYRPTTTSSVLLGILAIIIGIFALAWPGITILSLVLLFAVYAFITAGLQATRAFSSRSAGPVLGHLVLAVVDAAAGVFAVVWPAPTALVLVLIVGFWAIIGGVSEFFAAFRADESFGLRTLLILGGLVTVAFGLVILARPGIGALTLALLFGLFAFTYGIWQVVLGFELHSRRPPQ
jgi:uncharacterized membrane protein HdeD (DUF308 family)